MRWYILTVTAIVFVTTLPILIEAKKGPRPECAPAYFMHTAPALQRCKVK